MHITKRVEQEIYLISQQSNDGAPQLAVTLG